MRIFTLFFSLTLLAFCLVITQGSQAQTVTKGLIVSPERVVFETGQRVQELILANRGNTSAKYRISIINRKMDAWGNLMDAKEPAENEFFADEYIRYAPKQITLEGRETQKIRLMSRLPQGADAGEYRSHILIQELPNAAPAKSVDGSNDSELGVNVTAIFGISLPIILRRGELQAEASIQNPKITKREGQTFVDFELHRTGNKSIFGTVKVLTDGKEIGILRNVATYLSTPHRNISVRIDPEYANIASTKELQIVFGPEGDKAQGAKAEITFNP